MLTLLYHPIEPAARAARVMLHEKNVEIVLQLEPYWEHHEPLLQLNPEARLPILLSDTMPEGIVGGDAVFAYIEETYPTPSLWGETPAERAEIRRLASWFAHKFSYEVSHYHINERIIRYYTREGAPRAQMIRAANSNLRMHLSYLNFLLEHRRVLAGEKFSFADIIAACQLSLLDYLGDVPWENFPEVKAWYLLIKSRPSFKPLLREVIQGFQPSPYYTALDF